MSFHHLDQYAHVESALTRRSPTVRLLGTIVLALGAGLLPDGAWPQLAVLALLVLASAVLARIGARAFLLRLAPPLGLVVLVSVAILFLAPGAPVLHFGSLAITDAGLFRFGSTVGRGAVAVGAAVVLVSTTRFTDLVVALRALHLPTAVTSSLGLAYRFLYTLSDEIDRLRRAARSRNAGDSGASRRMLVIGITAATVQRSFDRSERVYRAMLSRGYDGTLPVLRPPASAGRPALELSSLALTVAVITGSALL